MKFKDLWLPSEIVDVLDSIGFDSPTEIQEKVIPILLDDQGTDVIATAQTGTGKTGAFWLPIISNINTSSKYTQALILSPTRELCLQITNDLKTFAKNTRWLNVVAVYGWERIDKQIRLLRQWAQIVVATPGRALDLIKRKSLKLQDASQVVLDEADEMLSMGFKEDLNAILSETNDKHQTLLFSATMSRQVEAISKNYMHSPIRIGAKKVNAGSTNISHHYYLVQARDKYELLKRIADITPDIYGIVFCRTRRETVEVSHKLMSDGYSADVLYGDLTQSQRDDVMKRFRNKQIQILVATDVAARGIDVDSLTHVINYSLPDDSEVYTHRSGRTGRAGNQWVSLVIAHSMELRKLKEIERRSGVTFERKKSPTGNEVCKRQMLALVDKISNIKVDKDQIGDFIGLVEEKFTHLDRRELIEHFVSVEFNRFLKYYKNAKSIDIEPRKSGSRSDRKNHQSTRARWWLEPRSARSRLKSSDSTRIHINMWRSQKMTPKGIMALVNRSLDSSSAQIGKIIVQNDFSIFEIDSSYSQDILRKMPDQEFEWKKPRVSVAKARKSGDFRWGSTKKKK